jgi:hypothetical protein
MAVKRDERFYLLPGLLSAQMPRRKIPVFSRNSALVLETYQKIAIKPIYSHLFLGEKK